MADPFRDDPTVHPVDVVRLAWGATLLTRPGRVLSLTGSADGRGARVIARVLGARHVAQGALLLALPVVQPPLTRIPPLRGLTRRVARRLGAGADALHAASAFGLAASGRQTRTWAADGVIASAFAADTWRTAGRHASHRSAKGTAA